MKTDTAVKCIFRFVILIIASFAATAVHASGQTPTLQCGDSPCGSTQSQTSASGPRAFAASTAGLSLFNKYSVSGDYIALGIGVRGSGSGNITVQGIPSGATILSAFLYWETLGDGQSGSFNGQLVSGTALGTTVSPCWPEPTITVYRADVLSLLAQGGNGVYNVKLPDAGDLVTSPSTEGVSLVIVYKKGGLASKTILLYDGAVTIPFDGRSVDGSSFATTITGFGPASTTPKARITYIVGDGQSFGSQLFFNGTNLGSVFNGSSGPLWDNITFDVSSLIPSGATQATTSSPIIGDCLTFGALIFAIDEGFQIIQPQDTTQFALTQTSFTATSPIDFQAGPIVPSATVQWTAQLDYATSKNRSAFNDTRKFTTDTTTPIHNETYSSIGGRVVVNAAQNTPAVSANPVTIYVVGTAIPDSDITSRLVSLYGGATANLMTGIATRESSYQQFATSTLFGVSALWPHESFDGGSHIGLMQMPTSQANAWDWTANTSNGVTLFNTKLATAGRLATRIIAAHSGLRQLTSVELEHMGLVLYGPYASASLSGQYYAPVRNASGAWDWAVNTAGNPQGVAYADFIFSHRR